MKFSVLMSVYAKERPDYLDVALRSVLVDQTLKPSELVLVEDGPLPAELHAVIERYKSARHPIVSVRLEENVGLGRALNAGLERCRHEWVARMDSDDISTPDRFAKQVEIIERYPDLDAVSACLYEFSGNPGHIVAEKRLPETPDEIRRYAYTRSPLNHPVAIFRKSSVLASGGYRHFPGMEDYYLWGRMLHAGFRLYNLPDCLLYFRTSDDMYRRRGGIAYLRNEIRLQREFYRMGFISARQSVSNIVVRTIFRIFPNWLRGLLYRRLLR